MTDLDRNSGSNRMPTRKHLHRLEHIWAVDPIFYVTTCTFQRRAELATDTLHDICREVWREAERLYGWTIGRYVLMPDHAHFFCAARRNECKLQTFVGKWKEWTAKLATRRHGLAMPMWQEGFFDHVLRSFESYEQKWAYVRENPLRAKLVDRVDDWPYQGEIHALRFEA